MLILLDEGLLGCGWRFGRGQILGRNSEVECLVECCFKTGTNTDVRRCARTEMGVHASDNSDHGCAIAPCSFREGGSVQFFASNGGAVPSFSGVYGVGASTPTEVVIVDVDDDGDADTLITSSGDATLRLVENNSCGPGFASSNGNHPCWACPSGQYTGGLLSTSCVPCPSGRFGNTTGAGSALCSGTCSALPGSVCTTATGSTEPMGAPCPPGRFGNTSSLLCDPCPAGRFGNAFGEPQSDCSGTCVATSGRYCEPSATLPTGLPCPSGFYCIDGDVRPCPAGTFGGVEGLSTAVCSGACTAPPGSYCGAGMTASLQGVPCPVGQFSQGGVMLLSCSVCPGGQFGAAIGLSSATCSGPCPVGRYSTTGKCVSCPQGTFGNVTALASPACAGTCMGGAGRFCAEGETTAQGSVCPIGRYSVAPGGSGSCSECPAGTWGSVTGLTSASCSGMCPLGYFSPLGASACTACPLGKFSDVTGASNCSLCPAGTYGAVTGLSSSTCTGVCQPFPGWCYIPLGLRILNCKAECIHVLIA
jgi:hypothetical protein